MRTVFSAICKLEAISLLLFPWAIKDKTDLANLDMQSALSDLLHQFVKAAFA